MINVPISIEELLKSDNSVKNFRITFPDGEHSDITNENLLSESVVLYESICSETQLFFGACESASLEFSTLFVDDLSGKIVASIEIICDSTQEGAVYKDDIGEFVYSIPYGTFYIDSCTKNSDGVTAKVVAYNEMAKIRNKNVFDWYNELEFPQTVRTFLSSFCNYVGVDYEPIELVNESMLIFKTTYNTDMTGMDVLEALGSINGVLTSVNRYGRLSFINIDLDQGGLFPAEDLYPDDDLFPQSNDVNIEDTDRISLNYGQITSKAPTGISVINEEGDLGGFSGTDENLYIIQNNFLLYGKDTDELDQIAENILANVENAEYSVISAKCLGNPLIEVGDHIAFNIDGEIVETYVLERTLTGVQMLIDSFSSNGSEHFEYESDDNNGRITQLIRKTNTLVRTSEELSNTITQTQLDLNNTQEYLESEIRQTAEEIESKVAAGSVVWNEEGYKIKFYGYGDPSPTSAIEHNVGDLYLDQASGILWNCKSVQIVDDEYVMAWSQGEQLEKTISEYYALIQQNTNSINAEISARESAITEEANIRASEISNLSASVNVTTSGISANVSALNTKVENYNSTLTSRTENLNSALTVGLEQIKSQVSQTDSIWNTSDYDVKFMFPEMPPSNCSANLYAKGDYWLNTNTGMLYILSSIASSGGQYSYTWTEVQSCSKVANSVQSYIEQSASAIELDVSSKLAEQSREVSAQLELKVGKDDNDAVVSMINASANVITLNSNRLVIDSDNFKLDQNGTMRVKNATIEGYATSSSLNSVDADVQNIKSNYITANQVASNYATITSLNTVDAKVNNLDVNKASVSSLNTVDAKINNLSAIAITTNNFSAQNINANKITSGNLSADRISTAVAGGVNGVKIQSNNVIATAYQFTGKNGAMTYDWYSTRAAKSDIPTVPSGWRSVYKMRNTSSTVVGYCYI